LVLSNGPQIILCTQGHTYLEIFLNPKHLLSHRTHCGLQTDLQTEQLNASDLELALFSKVVTGPV